MCKRDRAVERVIKEIEADMAEDGMTFTPGMKRAYRKGIKDFETEMKLAPARQSRVEAKRPHPFVPLLPLMKELEQMKKARESALEVDEECLVPAQ